MSAPPSADDDDAALLQIYRQSSREDAHGQLAAATRAAILAQARHASRQRRVRVRAWRLPVWAAAAAALLAVLMAIPQLRQTLRSSPTPQTETAANAAAASVAVGSASTAASAPSVSQTEPTGSAPLSASKRERSGVQPTSDRASVTQPLETSARSQAAGVSSQAEDDAAQLRVAPTATAARAVPADVRDAPGRTALIEATRSGQLARVQQLLARGADPNQLDVDGHSALWWARTDHRDQIAAALQAAGARD